MRRSTSYGIILWLLCLLTVSPVFAAGQTSKKASLANRINDILSDEKAKKCTWSIEVVSLRTGETLYQHNAHRAMIPASNMKLFTTAAALYYLGPRFTIMTSVYSDGYLNADGILNGNLILYGRGDPNISGRFTDNPTSIFEQIAESLKSRGLKEVRGNIIGDDSFFDSQYYGPWRKDHANHWYAARVSALSFNDNCVDIYVTPGASPGKKAQVSQSPCASYPKVINKASTTSRKSNSVWISPGGDGSAVIIGGKIWSRKKTELLYFPVESPALYAATVFKETLEKTGISVSGKPYSLGEAHVTAVPPITPPLYEYESLPLSEMIKVINKRSQNLHAELLFKQVGRQTGKGGSFSGGAQAVYEFALVAGADPRSTTISDGSGLSDFNRASAHSIARLLKYMNTNGWHDTFRESLAVVGVDSNLRTLASAIPKGRILAKTGSLKDVVALSGYAIGDSEDLAFSIIANDITTDTYTVKQIRNRICKELVNY